VCVCVCARARVRANDGEALVILDDSFGPQGCRSILEAFQNMQGAEAPRLPKKGH